MALERCIKTKKMKHSQAREAIYQILLESDKATTIK